MEKQLFNYESDLEQLNHLNAQLISQLSYIQQRLRKVIVGIGGDYLISKEERHISEPANNHISVYEYLLNTSTDIIEVMEKDLERLEKLASK